MQGPCIGNKSYEVDLVFIKNLCQNQKNNIYFINKKNKSYLILENT